MAWTHEELRLSEPAHGAAEMRAIDGEYLKLLSGDTSHPAWNVAGLSIPLGRYGVAVVHEARFPLRKFIDLAQIDPRVIRGGLPESRAQEISKYWHRYHCAYGGIQEQRNLEEEHATRVSCAFRGRRLPHGFHNVGILFGRLLVLGHWIWLLCNS
jgi:hypothetical protein